ncbi:hypothetical protein [Candidatus Protochlamydia phocaeensis]|uniref:hypothetical protein n=1 Tax=Candidatus Protochlamydia phocaeensis TaxID=1414722 RepID=UPI0008388A39|nr:hypothetical protein [Candidatus Protochlamydia phocaeensis]
MLNLNPSNYILSQEPLAYGGQQGDYIQKRDAAIARQLIYLEKAVEEKGDLKQFFHQALSSFAQTRHELAISHGTEEGHYFGRRRWDVLGDVSHTAISGRYGAFNSKITQFLSELLKNHIPLKGRLQKNTFKTETSCLERKCSFEVEILDAQDLAERELDRLIPSYIEKVQGDPNIKDLPEIEQADVDDKNYPPTLKEQKIIDAFKQNFKYVKQKHAAFYIHGKFAYILREISNSFPYSQKILTPEGVQIKKNADYLKSLFLFGKVRLEMNGKMYALSEYVTWSHQDLRTDPVERIKRSVVVIMHQDQFLIDETLEEIARIFEKAMQWDSSTGDKQAFIQQVALIRYLFAHCMPYQRGSAAIGEWLEKLIYQAKGFACEHSSHTLGDMEALAAPLLPDFLKVYETTINLSKLNSVAALANETETLSLYSNR